MIGIAHAQVNFAEWTKFIEGTDHSNTNMNNIITDGEFLYVNGIYFGETSTFGDVTLPAYDGPNGLISKLTTTGDVIWTATFGGNGLDAFYDIKLDHEGNIIAAGWTSSEGDLTINGTHTIPGGGPEWTNRGIVAKFSGTDGSLIWEKTWYAAEYYYANPVKIESDYSGNVYIAGYYSGAFEIDSTPFSYTMEYGDNLFLAKFNSDGELTWGKTFEGDDSGTWGNITSMDSNENGLYFVMSYNKPYLLNDEPMAHEGETYWVGIVNIDFITGDVIQHKSFGTSTSDQGGSSLIIDSEGNVIVGGHFTEGNNFAIQGIALSGYGSEDGYVAKFNSDLEVIWAKALGGEYLDRVFNLYVNQNNDVFVGGGFDSYTDFSYDGQSIIDAQSPNSLSMFEMYLNSEGEFQKVVALHGYDEFSILSNTGTVVLENNEIYTTGRLSGKAYFQDGGELINTFEHKGFVMKWDTNFEVLGLNEITNNGFAAYPNPFQNHLNILSSKTIAFDAKVYDLTGKLVYNAQSVTGKALNLGHLAKGIYILKLEGDQYSQTMKIIKK